MADANKVRDHLANERTFLAWVRTSLGLIGFGFVLARMGLFLREMALARALPAAAEPHAGREFVYSGLVFLAVGTAVTAWSARAYARNRLSIDTDTFIPAGTSVNVLSLVIVLGGLIIGGLAFWRALSA